MSNLIQYILYITLLSCITALPNAKQQEVGVRTYENKMELKKRNGNVAVAGGNEIHGTNYGFFGPFNYLGLDNEEKESEENGNIEGPPFAVPVTKCLSTAVCIFDGDCYGDRCRPVKDTIFSCCTKRFGI